MTIKTILVDVFGRSVETRSTTHHSFGFVVLTLFPFVDQRLVNSRVKRNNREGCELGKFIKFAKESLQHFIIDGTRLVDADSNASDTEAVERYLAAAEIGVAGETVVLGDTGYMPDLTGPARSDQALIWVIRDPALAGEARAAGMENDSVIAAEIVQLQQVKAAAGNSDTDAFFMRIGLSPADLRVTAAEQDEWYRAIGRGRSANNDLQTWLQRSKTAWMRTGYTKAQGAGAGFDAARDTTVTAAELDDWYLTIGRTQMGGGGAENDFQTWLQRTKIAWTRAGYVKALRASAKIEMLIE